MNSKWIIINFVKRRDSVIDGSFLWFPFSSPSSFLFPLLLNFHLHTSTVAYFSENIYGVRMIYDTFL